MAKVDIELGKQVHEYLVSKGVETPVIEEKLRVSDEVKIAAIKTHITAIMETLGMDLADDSLIETPTRIAKMYVNEIFRGLDYSFFPKCTTVENKMHYDEMVLEKDIAAISSCEHHFVTIDQRVSIGYIPKKRVLGLSKLNRIAKFFAQRPQIQERYAEQLFYALECILQTSDIAIFVRGKHYCVAQRGVEDTSSYTITSKLGGTFKTNAALRNEFMNLINSH
ncbi:GTP cyclohydrolase I FolE [Thioflexithrix psekupsensis]|uniref:GTP cyclohydrolase 1 n=1 Tax=Thioflexithrix psekupsensis TaxID=1570016 RepID=A0A251X452_9GAMM|nr:GTP cyclohydrolase I FolE [Thioflexithrix psekupsensis]OUD12166.1 GTP cyclohydrolase I FolE [Thioflexithrix psekupsensis]